MAQFGFENDIHNILKLYMPITNAPMARWQRKASSSMSTSSANTSALSPGKSANSYLTMSKTPSKTPGKNSKCTPSKAGGDRFFPTRNNKQMEVASFLLSKENEPMDTNPSGYQNNLTVLYSQVPTPVSTKMTRYISSVPDRILDASELRNDFYLNLLDWSSRNLLAVALHNSVCLWDAAQGDIVLLMKMEREEDYICSVSWIKEGNFLAIGTSDCKVQLWDVENQKRLRSMASHTARVASLSWNNHVLSSGSRSGHIHHHDVRVADHHIFTLSGHSQEVCVWADVVP